MTKISNVASSNFNNSEANATAVASAGGSYELIQKQTISSNVTSIDFNSISAPQEQIVLMFNGLTMDSGNGDVRLRFMDSSGNNIGGSSDVYQYGSRRFGYQDAGGGGQLTTYINLTHNAAVGGAANKPFNGTYKIYKFGTSNPFLTGTGLYLDTSNEIVGNIIASKCEGSATAARINIYASLSASNFTGGSVYLYKLV